MSADALPTDLHWAGLHVRTLCTHDSSGRLLRWNEPGQLDAPAPIFFFAATLHGNLWRFRHDLRPQGLRELSRLAAAERTPGELGRDPERLASFEEHLRSQFPELVTWRGLAFRFPETVPGPAAERLEDDDHSVLGDAFPSLRGSTANRMPCWVQREGSAIVSACCSSTASEAEAAVEAGVATIPSHRGRGLAAATVAAWASEIAASGKTPLYSAARDNRASRSVAERLGLELYASTLHFREPSN